jgi:NADPH:quinone reductase-like Zn-dependent oxidoreductase
MAVGSSVQEFQPGDRVVTHLAPKLVEASVDNASASLADVSTLLGQGTDEPCVPLVGLQKRPSSMHLSLWAGCQQRH